MLTNGKIILKIYKFIKSQINQKTDPLINRTLSGLQGPAMSTC